MASPLGFTEEGRLYYKTVLLRKARELEGVNVLDPWEMDGKKKEKEDKKHVLSKCEAMEIGGRNFYLIDISHVVLANLNGTDPDSGTCIEIGYAAHARKLVVGYRTDYRMAGEVDGMKVNLQVESAIRRSGGAVFDTLEKSLSFIREWKEHKYGE